MTGKKKRIVTAVVAAAVVLLIALVVVLFSNGDGGTETLWYALADKVGETPYGYQKTVLNEPAVYKGHSARRNRVVHSVSIHGMGVRSDLLTTTDYYLDREGNLLGYYKKTEYGEMTTVMEAWGEDEGLKVTKQLLGSEKTFDRTVPVPPDAMFPTSPSFLYPLVKDAAGRVSFDMFDFERLGTLRVAAAPEGTTTVSLPSGEFQARAFTMQIADLATGVVSGKQKLYFDKDGRLVLSETFGSGGKVESVFHLTTKNVVDRVEPKEQAAQALPYQGIPFRAREAYLILISMQGEEAGRASFIFYESSDVGEYRIEYTTRFVGPTEERAQTVNMYLDTDLTCLRYLVNGKVYDKDREKVDVSYNRNMVHTGRGITWEAWAEGLDKDEGGDRQGKIENADKVYVIDLHLFPGFALIASQLPLKIGESLKVPVFHSSLGKAGFYQASVTSKYSVGGETLYLVDMVGFAGRFVLYVDENHLLRRLIMPLDAEGERSLVYDLVTAPRPE